MYTNKGPPWCFFDGAFEGNLGMFGAREVLYILEKHYCTFICSLGYANYNMVEVNAIIILVGIEIERGISELHIFGNSKLLVDWINGHMRNLNLRFEHLI